jgi:signal transduction histidine kinase
VKAGEAFQPAVAADQAPPDAAKRLRALSAVGQARVAGAWQRLFACAIVALVATSVTGSWLPLLWLAVMALIIAADRMLFAKLLAKCARGEPPRLHGMIAWTLLQSACANIIAALLWFAPHVPGETLAIMFLAGGLATAAATLRFWTPLAAAGLTPTISFMLGLPVVSFIVAGAQNTLVLLPMVASFIMLGFGVNLWGSLLASDEAQARAEAAAIRERQAATAAAAAKSVMIRRMNDELRTPMAALVGAAEHLRRTATTPEARAHIATLIQAGDVLRLVLDDLSDLDRLENGQLRIETQPCDPRDLLRGVVSAFRAAAQDKHLELFLDIAPDVPARVDIDPRRVRQILFNLLANAVRYTAHGGVRVRLMARRCETPGRAKLVFVIADTGAGLSRSQLALIFGRNRAGGEGGSAGLGLAISLRLARLMGGDLSARSELGQGSVFTLSLEAPACAARSAA